MYDSGLPVLGTDDLINVESAGLDLDVFLKLQLAANQSPLLHLWLGHCLTQSGRTEIMMSHDASVNRKQTGSSVYASHPNFPLTTWKVPSVLIVYNNNDDDDDVSIRKPFLHSCMIISIIIIFKFLYLQSKSQKITCSRKEHV